jgi:hypothetical protein
MVAAEAFDMDMLMEVLEGVDKADHGIHVDVVRLARPAE